MRLILLLMAFIFMTMPLKVQSQAVLSARVTNAAERIAKMKSITTNITVDLKTPIQPLLGIRLLRVTTNSVMVANLVSGERCEMRLMDDNIDTEPGIVRLKSIDTKQEAAIFTLLKGVHSAMPTNSMLLPSYINIGEQAGPGYPPQGVGSPDP